MQSKSKLWRFSGLLRWLTMIMAAIYSGVFGFIWLGAALGHTQSAFEFMDIASTAPLTPLQVAFGFFCAIVFSVAMIVIAFAANQLLKQTYNKGFIQYGVSKGLRKLGTGLIILWAGLILVENFLPWAMTINLPAEQQKEIIWFILDPNLVAMLVGFVLILLADAVEEALAIDAENKQII